MLGKVRNDSAVKYVTCIYILLLGTLSLLASHNIRPFETELHYVPFVDKLCHFLFAGTLAFLLTVTLHGLGLLHRPFAVAGLALLLVAVVTIDEISQLFVSTRTFSWADLACNYGGILCFGLAAVFICRRPRRAELRSQWRGRTKT